MEVNGQKESRNPIKAAVITDKFNKFRCDNENDYKAKIKKMSAWELSEEAARIGFGPGSNRNLIERTLVEEFRKCKIAYDIASGKYSTPKAVEKEPSDQVKDMLRFMRS